MAPPKDAFQPGTRLAVGSQQVVVTRYLSHGGFAQVYLCLYQQSKQACLKRVVVPDKPSLAILRMEVDAMRRLAGKPHIVNYIDSNASRAPNGGYEVLVLMEYCSHGGLIDFMNTRLVHRLSEMEVWNIMVQITEAVAHMHNLSPPIVHRDIKIENVLLVEDGVYKLCDFGSSSPPLSAPKNVEQFKTLQDDIMSNTTPQYRSPEMLDLYKGFAIDEKSDIWALGVFMYKLCYFTTPFEQKNGDHTTPHGDYAIVHCIYSFPHHPNYSPRMKNVISKLLVANPNMRPNVFQLLEELCKIVGKPMPIFSKPVQPNLNITNTNASMSSLSSSLYNVPMQTASITPTKKKINYSAATTAASSIYSNNGAESIYSNPSLAPIKKTTSQLQPTQGNTSVAATATTRTASGRRRPLSMYAQTNSNSKDDLSNLIQDLKIENVKLSPDSKSKGSGSENIGSSMEFLRNISRQNTSQQQQLQQQQQHTSSQQQQSTGGSLNWLSRKKRSSITSIKDLLTGGSNKHSFTGGNNINPTFSRKSSFDQSNAHQQQIITANTTPRRIKSNHSGANISNGTSSSSLGSNSGILEDVQEMSPENKTIKHLPVSNKKSSIQERTARLFRRASVDTKKRNNVEGYGKYTDLNFKEATRKVVDPIKVNTKYQPMVNTGSDSNYHQSPTPEMAPEELKSVLVGLPNGVTLGDKPASTNTGRKKPVPPKPKKPVYLQGNGVPNEMDILEAKFSQRYPSVA